MDIMTTDPKTLATRTTAEVLSEESAIFNEAVNLTHFHGS